MSQTVGDFVVERLHAWGVRKMFGYPGDGINGVIEALSRADGNGCDLTIGLGRRTLVSSK